MSIYQDIILDHYHAPRNYGKLSLPTDSVTVDNPLCGDIITVQLKVESGKIANISFFGDGCAISKAASSLMTEYAKGKKLNSLINFSKDDMMKMLGIELSPNRIKCALLPWEALMRLLHKNDGSKIKK